MAPDGKCSNGCVAHIRDIGQDDELRRSSCAQQSARRGKERILLPRGTETIKYPDKLKAESHLAPPFIHQQRLGLTVKGKATADDELVKHMSNLPAYLQPINREDNFQEKVLNVGVLDWTQLEKWKLNQKTGAEIGGNVASSSAVTSKSSNVMSGSCSLPAALPHKSSARRSGMKDPLNSLPGSFHKDGQSQHQKPANSKVTHTRDSVSFSKVYSDLDKKIRPTNRSSGRNRAQVTVDERVRRKELSRKIDLTTSKSSAPVKRATSCNGDIKKSDQVRIDISEAGTASFSKLARCGEEVGPFDDETNGRAEKAEESDTEVSHQPRHRKQKSTALLLPKRFPQSSIPDMLKKKEIRVPSAPFSTELNRNSFSDSSSSGDLHSGVIFSEIPRSCPLPSRVETQSEMVYPTLKQTSDAASTSPSECQGFRSSQYAKRHGSNSEAASLDLAAELKIENQESPEPDARRSRNPSPNRRFSFSLGRMSRSFSFRETTSVPRLCPTHISAKSGPVSSLDSPCGDISNQERANPSSTRGRVSPLRRLLDPLLKSKSMSSRYSAENIQPLKSVNPSGPPLRQKHENFTVQALLQRTVKDRNSSLKFVVDKDSDVLAAAVSNSMSAPKHDSHKSCTFYSVNEIKKKSMGWIGQGNKAKDGGFACNVVGQMKVFNNSFSDWTLKRSNKQVITTECVLFGVDSRQADKDQANSIPNREVAAIVFEFSRKENVDSNSVSVILPGGVHGFPDKGEPSPLIDRWISGGSCDCGGWDVGCQLHVLSNKYRCTNTKSVKASSTSDYLELFAEVLHVC